MPGGVPKLRLPKKGYNVFFARRQRKLNRRQKKEVKNLIGRNIEKKQGDIVSGLTGVTYSGTVTALAAPANGTAFNQRVGDRIHASMIELNYSVVGYDSTNLMRIIIFKWNNDDGQYSPISSSILQFISVDYAPLSTYNYDNFKAKDFTICYDKTHALSFNDNAAVPGSQVITVRTKLFGKRLGNKNINFNTGATTGEGKYYLLAISDSAVAGHPKLNYDIRLTYSDA